MKKILIFACFLGCVLSGTDILRGEESLLIKTVPGRSGVINSVAFSPDGRLAASGGLDNTVKIWRFEDGSLVSTFEGHKNFVNSVAFSPDGKYLASASSDNTVKIWDVGTGSCLRTLKGHSNYVWSAAFFPDGKRIVSGSDDGTVKIWETDSAKRPRTLKGRSSYVYSVAVSPNGKYIASAGAATTIKLWDVESGSLLKTLEGHENYVNYVVFSPSGDYLASASDDGTVKVWRVEDGLCVKTFQGHSKPALSVAYSPDGAYLVSGGNDATLKVWSIAQGSLSRTLEGHRQFVKTAAVSPDGKYIVSGSFDKTMKVWLTPWEAERRDNEIRNYSLHYNAGLQLMSSPTAENLEKAVSEFNQALSFKRTGEGAKKLDEAAAALKNKREQTAKMIKMGSIVLGGVLALFLFYSLVYRVRRKKNLRKTLPDGIKKETLMGNYEKAFKMYSEYKAMRGDMRLLPKDELLDLYHGIQGLDALPKEELPYPFLLSYAGKFADEGNYRMAIIMLRSGRLVNEFKNPGDYDEFVRIYGKARKPETLIELQLGAEAYTGLAESFFRIKDYGSCGKICGLKKKFYADKLSSRDNELEADCLNNRPPAEPS